MQTREISETKNIPTDILNRMDAYWRAANYLSVGQIYLCDNPLLKKPLEPAHIKNMLLGHWGTTPGQNFIYVHLNRVICKYDIGMIYMSGPGHGGPRSAATRTSKARTPTSTPTSRATRTACASCFDSFHSPAAFRAMCRPSAPDRFTRV